MANDSIPVPDVQWSPYVDYELQHRLPCPGDPDQDAWGETAHLVTSLVTEGPRPYRCAAHTPPSPTPEAPQPVAPLAAIPMRPCAYHGAHEPLATLTVLRANGEALAYVCLPPTGRPQVASVPEARWPRGPRQGLALRDRDDPGLVDQDAALRPTAALSVDGPSQPRHAALPEGVGDISAAAAPALDLGRAS